MKTDTRLINSDDSETHVHVDSSAFFSYLAEKKPYGTVPLEVFLLPPHERLSRLGISFIDYDNKTKGIVGKTIMGEADGQFGFCKTKESYDELCRILEQDEGNPYAKGQCV